VVSHVCVTSTRQNTPWIYSPFNVKEVEKTRIRENPHALSFEVTPGKVLFWSYLISENVITWIMLCHNLLLHYVLYILAFLLTSSGAKPNGKNKKQKQGSLNGCNLSKCTPFYPTPKWCILATQRHTSVPKWYILVAIERMTVTTFDFYANSNLFATFFWHWFCFSSRSSNWVWDAVWEDQSPRVYREVSG